MVSQQYVQEAEMKIEKLAEFKEMIANDLAPILDQLEFIKKKFSPLMYH